MAKEVVARCYFGNAKIKGVRVEDADTCIPDRAYSGCTALSTVYIPAGVKKIGDAVFSGTSDVTVTYDGTERGWRMLTKNRTEKRDTAVRGHWDRAPYYHAEGAENESRCVQVSPLMGCVRLTVRCKKDGAVLRFGFDKN